MKEQIFDVGYLSAVKFRLKVLLNSEITPISDMSHDGDDKQRSIEDEGRICIANVEPAAPHLIPRPTLSYIVSCKFGDWVEVSSDYSPGKCSEGGTDVLIAKNEGENKNINYFFIPGLATVKYIYGPATVCHRITGRSHWVIHSRSD